MRTLLAAAMLGSLCGCALAAEPAADTGSCDATKAQSLVGQTASGELAARAKRLSRAHVVRWLQSGQIITMEYRVGRLNIVLDANNKVEAIRCG